MENLRVKLIELQNRMAVLEEAHDNYRAANKLRFGELKEKMDVLCDRQIEVYTKLDISNTIMEQLKKVLKR